MSGPAPPGTVAEAAAAAGVALAVSEVIHIEKFLALLIEENRRQNLTTVTDRPTLLVDHVADCLALLPVAARHGRAVAPGRLCVDLGSGGGFPGLLLACAVPDVRWILVESEGRKADWLRRAALELALPQVEVFEGRGRDLRHVRPETADSVDLITARAVAELGRIAREVRGLLSEGGLLLCPKGRNLEDAERKVGLREAGKSRLEFTAEDPMEVPGRERVCAVFRKSGMARPV